MNLSRLTHNVLSKFESFTVEEKLNFPLVTLNRDDFSCIDFSLIKRKYGVANSGYKSDRSSNSVSKLSSSYNGSSSKKVSSGCCLGKATRMSIANSTTVSQKSDINCMKKRDTISVYSGKMTTNSEEFKGDL